MKSLSAYKVILWDFDGVLMDSMPIRDEGFRHVLSSYDKAAVDDLMKYHRLNGGLSRYVKFRYFFEEILKQNVDEAMISQLAASFSQVMLKLLVDQSLLITDSINFVQSYHTTLSMHIVSGSDGNELRFICNELNIARYFKSIHGSPTPKKELIKTILAEYQYNPDEVILIGDSINDYDAAIANNIHFAGYNNTSLKSIDPRYINTFSQITI